MEKKIIEIKIKYIVQYRTTNIFYLISPYEEHLFPWQRTLLQMRF